ncbi:unnamed protein product [Bemisia tabaci]|uniref:Uncharacterized protein n=1 Tax=Bemisia tabaci TaxID=7038 RepID=A0A9P0A2K5_BEMTA|nr:unnamed protein product [Bemisia tabaci]
MKDIHVFSLLVVMLLPIQGGESRKKKGGWFYTKQEDCQFERCDPKYGHFKEKGTEHPLQRLTIGHIGRTGICRCKLSKDFTNLVKRLYNRPTSWLYRAIHFAGFGRKIRKFYKKIEFREHVSGV